MDISLILKITGIGLLISVACQVLSKSGRDEQATMLTIAGIIVVMIMIITELDGLFSLLFRVFGFWWMKLKFAALSYVLL